MLRHMPACHLSPSDKKALVSAVGQELVRVHGKQKYYKPSAIRRATEVCGYSTDYACWSLAMFSTPSDFKMVHDATGEVCDYVAMKSEVLVDLASGASFSILDVDLSWLEWPDIDLSSVFDWFDFT